MDNIIFYFKNPIFQVSDMFNAEKMALQRWEELLAEGWRHNGKLLFRTSHDFDEKGYLNYVLPLRSRLKGFKFSKSQRKIFNKNQDLTHVFRPFQDEMEKHELFYQHIEKFKFQKPDSIFNFVSPEPNRPFKTWELCVYNKGKLIACSFIDITKNSLSSTYAMYDLEESKRSLGIYTMVLELKYAIEKKKKFYYPGYAYYQPSFFDYKKKFDNTEFFDWISNTWMSLSDVENHVAQNPGIAEVKHAEIDNDGF